MSSSKTKRFPVVTLVKAALFILVVGGGFFTQGYWLPYSKPVMDWIQNKKPKTATEDGATAAAPAAVDSITLSDKAAKNIGLETGPLKLSNYTKTVPVPAIVALRPGRSQVKITTPMTGVVTRVFSLERSEVKPGQKLFDLRLTHEDVVTAQSNFLNQLQKLDVLKKELDRLNSVGQGVVPGRRIIEQKYKVDEAGASLAATRQTLLLHGFSAQQVLGIERTRKVLTDITVVVPPYPALTKGDPQVVKFHVQSIDVHSGQSVDAGELLGVLANYSTLYVEGNAFEDDAARLIESANTGRTLRVKPFFRRNHRSSDQELELAVESISDQIDLNSRVLKFFMILPNETLSKGKDANDSFVIWKYRPGQRMEVHIPASETYEEQFVLPPSAVAFDGPNAFVFEQNGKGFDRIDVRVLYKSNDAVVVEKDLNLLGSVITFKGAYHMNLALKNASGGAIDPHAGHNH